MACQLATVTTHITFTNHTATKPLQMEVPYRERLLIIDETSSEYIKLQLKWANLPTNGNKQVLYERYLGHWLEKRENEAANTEALKRYEEQRKIEAEKARVDQLTDDDKDRLYPKWKQCWDCQKWRALPHDLLLEKLPEHWVCSMNSFDSEHNSCDKSEAARPPCDGNSETVTVQEKTTTSEEKEEDQEEDADDSGGGEDTSKDNSTWVQCDDCSKWRALPKDTVVEDLPDLWTCALNTDSARDSCDKSEADHDDFASEDEEEEDDDEVDEYGLTEAYKQEVLRKFKEYKVELQQKKRAREERDEELAKERTERMVCKQQEIFAAWSRKVSAPEVASRKRAANRANERGRLPISTYPYELDEAKAYQQLLRDLHCGVDVNAEDKDGLTAIYHAYMNHYDGYVELLLSAGAEDHELHLESDDYFMSLENRHRRKKPRDEWGLDKFL